VQGKCEEFGARYPVRCGPSGGPGWEASMFRWRARIGYRLRAPQCPLAGMMTRSGIVPEDNCSSRGHPRYWQCAGGLRSAPRWRSRNLTLNPSPGPSFG